MTRSRWLLLALLAFLVLAGLCFVMARWAQTHWFVDADQSRRDAGLSTAVVPGQPVGQTFVARHAGLAGIEFYLEPASAAPVALTLHLRSDPQSTSDLATSAVELPAGSAPGYYRFSIPPLRDSHGQYYYAFVEERSGGEQDAGTGGVSVALADGDAYLDGAAHQAHQPLDAQASFRLVYSPSLVVLDLVSAVPGWLGLLAITFLLFVVPGWALVAWLLAERRLRWAEMLGLAAGVSLALYPLLFLWTDLVGLHLGLLYAWLPAGLGLLALVWRYRSWRPRQGWNGLRAWVRSAAVWPDVVLLFVMALVFGIRLITTRTLEAPMWADSVQHTTMAQLLVNHGGLFDSWEPYAPYQSLTVHFGFPVIAALLSWVTARGVVLSTLLAGQIVNGLAVLTLYPLAVCIAGRNRWAGVGAVLIAGLVSPMPAYYVNWGRYAQLAGLAILPAALWLVLEVIQEKIINWSLIALAGFAAAGMALAYYRMPFYYALFVLAWLIAWGIPHWRLDGRSWLAVLFRLALVAATTALLLLPWILHVVGGTLAAAVGSGITAASPVDAVVADYEGWLNVVFYVSLPVAIGAIAALIWSLVKRCWSVAAVGLWVLGLSSLVAGQLVHLPGASMIQNFAILISLYVPAGLLIGWLIGELVEPVQRRSGRMGTALASIAVIAVALWATVGQTRLVGAGHALVTRPDTQAMDWIKQNTPPDARFLVGGYRIYGGRSAIGSDAGWWIPILASRRNTMPPQYALLNETPAEPGYSQGVVDLVARLEELPPASPEGVELLCEWRITHVYVGQGRGQVGIDAEQLFAPDSFDGSPAFNQVYQRDRVSIFALHPEVCGGGR